MRVNVRFPTLKGRSIRTAAKDNEQKLVKSMSNLIIQETNKKRSTRAVKPVDGGRLTQEKKKPKTFAL